MIRQLSDADRPMTLAEHIALGNHIKAVWRAQGQLRVVNTRTSRIATACRKAEAALTTIKSVLDDEVCGLVPRERDPRRLATQVYYGQPLVACAQANPLDAFDGWEVDERERGE